MQKSTSITFLVVIFLLLTACSAGSQKSQTPSAKSPAAADLELAAVVEEVVQKHEAVDEVVAVVLNKHISTAFKVSGFHRLRLKQIRREVNDLIQEAVPSEYTVHITTDKRLIRDLKKVARDIKANDGIALPQTHDELEKINKDMHG